MYRLSDEYTVKDAENSSLESRPYLPQQMEPSLPCCPAVEPLAREREREVVRHLQWPFQFVPPGRFPVAHRPG